MPMDLAPPGAAAAPGTALAERGLCWDVLVNGAGCGPMRTGATLGPGRQVGILDLRRA